MVRLCTELLTDSPRVTLVVFSKMLWVMGARGGDSAQTPLTVSQGCVQHQHSHMGLGLHVCLGQVLFPVSEVLAGSESHCHGQDSMGCS